MPNTMTTPTNWPNPERPGVPPNPDVSGWHWVMRLGELLAVKWDAQSKSWKSGNHSYYTGPDWVLNWEYCSPILTPTQLTEMLAGERERCAQEAIHIGESWGGTELSPTNTAHHIAHSIRNLGDAA